MSLDFQLASVAFGLAILFLILGLGSWWIQRTIDRAIVSSGHAFYVGIHHEQPKCATCPFKGRCPYYAKSSQCRFARSTISS